MRMKPFRYVAPEKVEDALKAISKGGRGARILAGGTDLVVQMKQGMAQPECLIDLRMIPELHGIREHENGLSIGSMTRLWEVEHSPIICQKWPLLAKAASEMGAPAIRHVATIGGNLCNASPAADSSPPLLVIEAKLLLKGAERERMVSISDFFEGPAQTVLRQDEILHSIFLPPLPDKCRTCYLRLGRKRKGDLALVGVALVLVLDPDLRVRSIRIGLGGVAPTPIRAEKTEEWATGKVLQPSLIEKTAREASEESKPISDIRGSSTYKKDLIVALVSKGLKLLTSGEEAFGEKVR